MLGFDPATVLGRTVLLGERLELEQDAVGAGQLPGICHPVTGAGIVC